MNWLFGLEPPDLMNKPQHALRIPLNEFLFSPHSAIINLLFHVSGLRELRFKVRLVLTDIGPLEMELRWKY